MLKTFRISLAILSIVAVTLLFLDFTGTAQNLWPWMAKIQFIPALLSVNLLAIGLVVIGTFLLGRVYCSVICPLGILQDMISWAHGRVMGKKKRRVRFKYEKARKKTRLIMLTVFLVLVAIGLFGGLAMAIAGLVEPYSAFGRIASQIFAPGYDEVNNLLADWSASQPDNYMFYKVAISISIPLLVVAIFTLLMVGVMSWIGGRDYCNRICPVGTILGYLSRYSLLRPVIDENKCVGCTLCARGCKAKCIDAKSHTIDYSRCVDCMDCISICKEKAIAFTWRRNKSNSHANKNHTSSRKALSAQEQASRRGFVFSFGLIAASLAFKGMAKTDGGLTPLKQRKSRVKNLPVVPAGAKSLKHLKQHCTACQLCIQSCPSKVLKPTMTMEGFMQPQLNFLDGYCQPDCTVCSNICPVGAFHPVTEEEKSSIKVGTAKIDLSLCLSARDGENCGSCASHCPTGAITMVEGDDMKFIPIVLEDMCIGCGACEHYCPVGTVATMESDNSAIYVEGIEQHRVI